MKSTARALAFVVFVLLLVGCAGRSVDVDSESHFQCTQDSDCASAPGRSVCRNNECVSPDAGPIVLDESAGPLVDCMSEWPPEALSFQTTGSALDVDDAIARELSPPKLNRNGTVVVGHASHISGSSPDDFEMQPGHLIRWTGDTLSRFAQMTVPMVPHSVSCDGMTLVGGTETYPNNEPYRWSARDGFALLPAPDGMSPGVDRFATAVSQDGSTAWGVYQSGDGTTTLGASGSHYRTGAVAVRWEGTRPAEALFTLPDATDWSPGWTSDGSAFNGHTVADFFVQRREGSPTFLGTPMEMRVARADAISADGRVFAGSVMATDDDGYVRPRAFLWTVQSQLEDVLGNANVAAVTPGGTIVGNVGRSATLEDLQNRTLADDFVWDRSHGARRLHEVLSAHGLTLPRTTVITGSTDISVDGRVITGFCTEGGKERYFRAVLPAGTFE